MKRIGTVALLIGFAIAFTQIFAQQAGGSKASAKALKAERELGAKLYEKYSCKSCHGDKGKAQGDLTRAYSKYTDAQLKAYIKDPNKFNNYKMPVFGDIIPDADYKPLLAYIKWLGREAAKAKK